MQVSVARNSGTLSNRGAGEVDAKTFCGWLDNGPRPPCRRTEDVVIPEKTERHQTAARFLISLPVAKCTGDRIVGAGLPSGSTVRMIGMQETW